MYNAFTIEEIHEELLLLLKYFNIFCNKHNIKYSLHGGTLLGAIREKGFIPWDDDVDITLTRGEYSKLRSEISINDLGYGLEFEEFGAQKPMLWLKREGKPKVWADIFIYDYISDNYIKKNIKILIMAFFLGIMKTEKTLELTKKGSYKGWKYIIIYLLHTIGKIFSAKNKVKALNFIAENLFTGNRKLIFRSNDQYKALSMILPKSVMDAYMYTKFEDTELMISRRYDVILTSSYGADYMTPKRFSLEESEAHSICRETF